MGAASWFLIDLSTDEAAFGTHKVRVVLQKRNPKLASDITVTNVELLVRYDEEPEQEPVQGVRRFDIPG